MGEGGCRFRGLTKGSAPLCVRNFWKTYSPQRLHWKSFGPVEQKGTPVLSLAALPLSEEGMFGRVR